MTRVPVLVGALGIAQIISWGTLFYAIGVLGPAMRAELGASELFLFSAFTAALLVSSALSPLAGRMIDRHGGRTVLSTGSLLAAAAWAILAASGAPAVLAFGWLVAGAAMATCLYDPAFATLSQHAGVRYRESVSALTIFGGLASTVFWPISQLGLETLGWRQTCLVFVALHLFVCLPIHWGVVPAGAPPPVEGARPAASAGLAATSSRSALAWLTASLALATFVFTAFAVHMIELLTSAGLSAAEAVTVAMLFGPVQVAGRVIDMTLARHVKAVSVGYASFSLLLLAIAALMAVHGLGAMAFVFVIAYGIGNGILTIVRGTVPAELFGRHGLATILGRVSRAALLARALAPAAFSALLTFGLSRNQALACLAAAAIAGAGCYGMALRAAASGR